MIGSLPSLWNCAGTDGQTAEVAVARRPPPGDGTN